MLAPSLKGHCSYIQLHLVLYCVLLLFPLISCFSTIQVGNRVEVFHTSQYYLVCLQQPPRNSEQRLWHSQDPHFRGFREAVSLCRCVSINSHSSSRVAGSRSAEYSSICASQRTIARERAPHLLSPCLQDAIHNSEDLKLTL